MKIYITEYSPYARMPRIVVLEKMLADRVEFMVAQTRVPDSPYYAINPSGRVPYLVRDDGIGIEESQVVCAFLDQIDGEPLFALPTGDKGWELRRLEVLGRSMMDGVSVWIRELLRPGADRSATILEHERCRAQRMADKWESEIDNPLMSGPLNMAQITLVCDLQLDIWNPKFDWRDDHPKLLGWVDRLAARPSISATVPPGPIGS